MRFMPPSVSSYLPIIANELVSVRPMDLPSGLLFYMDHLYDNLSRVAQEIAEAIDREVIERPIEDVGLLLPKRVDPSRFPHRCPRCGAAAYVGLNSIDCSKECV